MSGLASLIGNATKTPRKARPEKLISPSVGLQARGLNGERVGSFLCRNPDTAPGSGSLRDAWNRLRSRRITRMILVCRTVSMAKQDDYRNYARDAVRLASNASSTAKKTLLLALAERWLDLADTQRGGQRQTAASE
jgi:hypothetical protein